MRTVDSVCTDCGSKLRPSRIPLSEAPDTKGLGGGGMCNGCWERAKKSGAVRVRQEAPALADFDHKLAAVALEAYLVERRKRLGRWAA